MQKIFDLDRFTKAQTENYATALQEIRDGRKRTHWIWYVFPQIAGLGHSPTAQHYAIQSLDEAKAYLADPILGERLETCVKALQALPHHLTAEAVFGQVDAMKLRSSLTLFIAAGAPPIFDLALKRWFDGEADAATLRLLGTQN